MTHAAAGQLVAPHAPPRPENKDHEPAMASASRETVLDRITHIEKEWVLEIPQVPRLCDKLHLTKRRVNVGDCELYCDEEGIGTPIVLVHGGPGATHHYFHPWFSRAASFARVIYYDQRGCGLSDYNPGTGYSVSQAVEDLEKLRQGLGVDAWIVAGHSYGGYLAQRYAATYPEHVAGLVLIASAEGVQMPLGTRQGEYLTAEEKQRISQAHQANELTPQQRLFNAHLNGDWKRQNFYRPSRERLAQMVRYEWVHDPSFRAQIGNTISKDLDGVFDTCPLPTLILEGKWDLTWGADKPEKMQAMLPRAKVVVFERSGHSPFEDEPDRFFIELEKFVRGLRKRSSDELAAWRKDVEKMSGSAPHIIRRIMLASPYGEGAEASQQIVRAYKKEWLAELHPARHARELRRLGWALYDEKKYEDALEVFQKSDDLVLWQAQLLDLLGRRAEAVRCYEKALKSIASHRGGAARHDQYGIVVNEDYIKERLDTPFTRRENRWDEIVRKRETERERYRQLPPYRNVQKALASPTGWGKAASHDLAAQYQHEWLTQIDPADRITCLRLGFALYDEKMYGDALEVFRKGGNLVWQGHMLDLLGRRNEAMECYQKALDKGMGAGRQRAVYSQYGIAESQEYVRQFLVRPFTRVENNVK